MNAAGLTKRGYLKVVLAGVLLAATLVVVLVATEKPADAALAGAHESDSQIRAYGHGDYLNAPGYSFDFSAQGDLLSGSAQGFLDQTYEGAFVVRAEVSCLTVDGDTVTLGGYTTEPGNFLEGEWVVFTVRDGGPNGEDDAISSIGGSDFGASPGVCSPVENFWDDVSNGDVVVACAKVKEKKCKPPNTEK